MFRRCKWLYTRFQQGNNFTLSYITCRCSILRRLFIFYNKMMKNSIHVQAYYINFYKCIDIAAALMYNFGVNHHMKGDQYGTFRVQRYFQILWHYACT